MRRARAPELLARPAGPLDASAVSRLEGILAERRRAAGDLRFEPQRTIDATLLTAVAAHLAADVRDQGDAATLVVVDGEGRVRGAASAIVQTLDPPFLPVRRSLVGRFALDPACPPLGLLAPLVALGCRFAQARGAERVELTDLSAPGTDLYDGRSRARRSPVVAPGASGCRRLLAHFRHTVRLPAMSLSVRVAARVAFPLALAPAGATSPAFAQTPAAPPAKSTEAPVPTPAQVQASTAEAKRLSEGFVAVADHASPSVVQIDVTARDEKADLLSHFFGRNGRDEPVARGMGSGVVFTPDGAILTNNHVVEEALTINVRLRDGRYLPGRLVGRDPATDLAVVKVDATGLTPAKFADSDAARVGEWVVAIGSPFGLGYTVTAGVLSAKGRGGLGMNAIEDYLQTDASINPGNSGGPLCNLQGDVLGINTMIVGRGQGIGFAVPSNLAQRVAGQILKTGHVSRAWLGVSVQDVTPEIATAMHLSPGAGALVNNVAADGPAFKANLRAGRRHRRRGGPSAARRPRPHSRDHRARGRSVRAARDHPGRPALRRQRDLDGAPGASRRRSARAAAAEQPAPGHGPRRSRPRSRAGGPDEPAREGASRADAGRAGLRGRSRGPQAWAT